MFGALKEHGPFLADVGLDGIPFLSHNPYTWNGRQHLAFKLYILCAGNHSVLYVDNPVGTGFSFTDDPADYPHFVEESTEVLTNICGLENVIYDSFGQDLYNMLQQFFVLFPEHADREFFAMGESYGGK